MGILLHVWADCQHKRHTFVQQAQIVGVVTVSVDSTYISYVIVLFDFLPQKECCRQGQQLKSSNLKKKAKHTQTRAMRRHDNRPHTADRKRQLTPPAAYIDAIRPL